MESALKRPIYGLKPQAMRYRIIAAVLNRADIIRKSHIVKVFEAAATET
jgi:hypothetical protein